MKKEILKNCNDEVLSAIDEYTKEVAIGFLEWKDRYYVSHSDYCYGVYYHKKDLLNHISKVTIYTTEELFEKYLQDKNINA